MNGPDVHSIPYASISDERVAVLNQWPAAEDLLAIDFFCGPDPQDPTGQLLVTRLVAFVKALIPYRVSRASRLCRLTVVTRGATVGCNGAHV